MHKRNLETTISPTKERSRTVTQASVCSDSFPHILTQPPDQSNELITDLDQFGDDFNWNEDFGGDFDDVDFGEFGDQSNAETKTADPQEPLSGRSSKRGFEEIDSDTADEEQAPGDVSPSEFLSIVFLFSKTHVRSLQTQNGRRCCSPNLRRTGHRSSARVAPAPISFFPFSLTSLDNRPKVKYLSALAS
jgi:hypothetical protein